MDHPLAFDHALSFREGRLHDELVERRPKQVGCLLKGVLNVLRHPRGDAATIEGCAGGHEVNSLLDSRVGLGIMADWCHFVTIQGFGSSPLPPVHNLTAPIAPGPEQSRMHRSNAKRHSPCPLS